METCLFQMKLLPAQGDCHMQQESEHCGELLPWWTAVKVVPQARMRKLIQPERQHPSAVHKPEVQPRQAQPRACVSHHLE